MSFQMPEKVSYYLDEEETEFDYRVEGDDSFILLRNRRDLNGIAGVTNHVEVSPVSVQNPPVLAEELADLIAALILVTLYVLTHVLFVCARVFRSERRLNRRRAAARALALWEARRPFGTVPSLSHLSMVAALSRMRRPVKRNIRGLALPQELKDEMARLRQFPLSVAHQDPSRV